MTPQEAINKWWAILSDVKGDYERCRKALMSQKESVEGDRGHDALFAAACTIARYGYRYADPEAFELISLYNEKRCHPPWEQDELRRKLEEGYGETAEQKQFGIDSTRAPTTVNYEIKEIYTQWAEEDKDEWLIKDLVIAGKGCMWGGPKKALKTTLMLEMTLCLASGTDFLGKFEVPEPKPVLVFTGETCSAVFNETTQRICKERGIVPTADTYFTSRMLPQIGIVNHLEQLEKDILSRGIKLCVLDPMYLCTLSADTLDYQANVHGMSLILREIKGIVERTGCTICLVHHARKSPSGKELFDEPELGNFSGAGWGEFARQWIIIGHRQKTDGKQFWLWMVTGGENGQAETYAVDVDQGNPKDPLVGRQWHTTIKTADEIYTDREAETTTSETAKREEAYRRLLQCIVERPHTLTELQRRTGLGRQTERRLNELVMDGRISYDADTAKYVIAIDLFK